MQVVEHDRAPVAGGVGDGEVDREERRLGPLVVVRLDGEAVLGEVVVAAAQGGPLGGERTIVVAHDRWLGSRVERGKANDFRSFAGRGRKFVRDGRGDRLSPS